MQISRAYRIDNTFLAGQEDSTSCLPPLNRRRIGLETGGWVAVSRATISSNPLLPPSFLAPHSWKKSKIHRSSREKSNFFILRRGREGEGEVEEGELYLPPSGRSSCVSLGRIHDPPVDPSPPRESPLTCAPLPLRSIRRPLARAHHQPRSPKDRPHRFYAPHSILDHQPNEEERRKEGGRKEAATGRSH